MAPIPAPSEPCVELANEGTTTCLDLCPPGWRWKGWSDHLVVTTRNHGKGAYVLLRLSAAETPGRASKVDKSRLTFCSSRHQASRDGAVQAPCNCKPLIPLTYHRPRMGCRQRRNVYALRHWLQNSLRNLGKTCRDPSRANARAPPPSTLTHGADYPSPPTSHGHIHRPQLQTGRRLSYWVSLRTLNVGHQMQRPCSRRQVASMWAH